MHAVNKVYEIKIAYISIISMLYCTIDAVIWILMDKSSQNSSHFAAKCVK